MPEIYVTSSILVVVIFWIAALIRLQENRYVIGTVQFLRNEFIILIQTFLIGILLTVLLKITGLYSRVWLVAFFVLSLSSHVGTASMGKLLIISLFSIFLTNLTILIPLEKYFFKK